MSRIIILGDIHGCYDELCELLNKINFVKGSDKLISLGDVLHKGPEPIKCLELIRQNCEFEIASNHHEKQLRWEKHEDKKDINPSYQNPMQNVSDYIRLSEDQLDWIRNFSKLFHQFESGGKKFILAHGGILSSISRLPASEDINKLSGRDKSFYYSMLRTRFERDGKMVQLGQEKENDVYWADKYDGRFGHAIFGHQHFMLDQPNEFPHATGIDLGCVYGNRLCALIIENGSVSYSTVLAKKKYRTSREEEME